MSSTAPSLSLPAARPRWLAWLRGNLFKSVWDALFTALALVCAAVVLWPVLTWAIQEARWEVLSANLNLLLRGRYPAEAAWRIWAALSLIAIASGLSFATWGRKATTALAVIACLPLALALLPFLSLPARLALLLVSALVGASFFLGRLGPPAYMPQITTSLIVLLLPLGIVLLRGFGTAGGFAVAPTRLWGGLLLSVILAASGIVFSYPLGILLALGRRSKLPVLRLLCILYIEFIRGVPLISLLFMSVTMLQLFLPAGFPQIDGIIRVGVAITLFSAAYGAENLRGGLAAIPKGQYEATWALGLNQFQSMTFVILPQALKTIIPVTVSQFIFLFKDTTLVSLVGLLDLLGIARSVLSNPEWLGTHREIYFFIGAVFWILNYWFSFGSRKLERKLNAGQRNLTD